MSDSRPSLISIPDPSQFKRPPIVRREAQLWLDVSQEDFDLKVPSLISVFEEHGFTDKKVKELWEFQVELRNGKMAKPKVTMTQIPEVHRSVGSPLTLTMVPPHAGQAASMTLVQPYHDENPNRFEHLLSECKKWSPLVFNHFGLTETARVSLAYRNELTRPRYPEIWQDENGIRLAEMLRLYSGMPHIQNPSFALGFIIDYTRNYVDAPGRSLRVRLNSEPSPPEGHLWAATFIFNSVATRLKGQGLAGAFQELADGHNALYQEFCIQFSEQALKLFSK